MKTYTKITTDDGYEFIQVNDGGVISSIPIDPANSDYQRYLNPEAEQSTPNLPGNADKL